MYTWVGSKCLLFFVKSHTPTRYLQGKSQKTTRTFSMIIIIIDPCKTKTSQAPCIISDSLLVGKINPLAWAYENKTIIFPYFLSVQQQYNNFCRQHVNVVVVVVLPLRSKQKCAEKTGAPVAGYIILFWRRWERESDRERAQWAGSE